MEHPLLTALIKSYLANNPAGLAGCPLNSVKTLYQSSYVNESEYILLCGNLQMSNDELIYLQSAGKGLQNKLVNIMPILDYKIESNVYKNWPKGYVLYNHAPGQLFDVVSADASLYNSIPQRAIDKLAYDAHMIRQAGLVIDAYGKNLFYDPKDCKFTFIDLIPAYNLGHRYNVMKRKKFINTCSLSGLANALIFQHRTFLGDYMGFVRSMIKCNRVSLTALLQSMLFRNVSKKFLSRTDADMNRKIRSAVKRMPEIIKSEDDKYRAHCDDFAKQWDPKNKDYDLYWQQVNDRVEHFNSLAARDYTHGE